VVLLALTLTLGACEGGSPFTPDTLPGPGGGNGGTSVGDGNAAVRILGTWEATIITFLPANDFVTERTTWIYRADTTCLRVVESEQFSEGIMRTTIRGCTYTLGQGIVRVLYDGATLPTLYPFSFPINDTNRLVLSGITYERIP